MFASVKEHFNSITPIPPGSEVVTFVSPNLLRMWKTGESVESGSWQEVGSFRGSQEVDSVLGDTSLWSKTLMINGDSLSLFYEDASKYKLTTAFIVDPKPEFYSCKKEKPTLFKDYMIKDKYKALRKKLPELEGIF